jgi:hypothetical protein
MARHVLLEALGAVGGRSLEVLIDSPKYLSQFGDIVILKMKNLVRAIALF